MAFCHRKIRLFATAKKQQYGQYNELNVIDQSTIIKRQGNRIERTEFCAVEKNRAIQSKERFWNLHCFSF